MNTQKRWMKTLVRPIGLSWLAVTFGSVLSFFLKALLDLEIPKPATIFISFGAASFAAFYLFPRRLKLPFEDGSLSGYLRALGFVLPRNPLRHVLLGVFLASSTLVGMLIGSLLTGRYSFDPHTLDPLQILFSINPGIWEEFFYRGVVMFLLLVVTRSLPRATLIQIVIFGLAHVKNLDPWGFVDVVSVMLIAVVFTYTAHKTRTLLAGMVFHFVHDAFLFLPQLPGATYIGASENLAFYLSLWGMLGIGLLVVRFAAERLGVRAEAPLYSLEKIRSPVPSADAGSEETFPRAEIWGGARG